MKIVCISDTHGIAQPDDLPDGDVLIHAGDLTLGGQIHEVQHALAWLRKFPHKHKLVIGGNHDNTLQTLGFYFFKEQAAPWRDRTPITYLNSSGVTIDGVRFFGSPVAQEKDVFRPGARAFMQRDGALLRHWALIPNCDVLITHGPPKGALDNGWGDEALAATVHAMRPKLHVFGHVHYTRGVLKTERTTFVNAAMVDDAYRPVHDPIVIDL